MCVCVCVRVCVCVCARARACAWVGAGASACHYMYVHCLSSTDLHEVMGSCVARSTRLPLTSYINCY